MKNYIFALICSICIFSQNSLANGECVVKEGASSSMCKGKSKSSCDFNSDVCEWRDPNTIKVIVEERKASKSCVAQEGKEAHENFCKNLERFQCKAHSSVCIWE